MDAPTFWAAPVCVAAQSQMCTCSTCSTHLLGSTCRALWLRSKCCRLDRGLKMEDGRATIRLWDSTSEEMEGAWRRKGREER